MLKKTILFLYIALITTLSILPASDIPDIVLFPYFDKLVHLCFYAGFSFLLLWLWDQNPNKNKYFLILGIVFGWGLLMEIIQGITHLGRSFDVLDMGANLLGFFPGLLAWKGMEKVKEKRKNKK